LAKALPFVLLAVKSLKHLPLSTSHIMHKRILLLACLACGANGHRIRPLEERKGLPPVKHRSPQGVLDALSRQHRVLRPSRVFAAFLGASNDPAAAFTAPSPHLPARTDVSIPTAATEMVAQARAPLQKESRGALEGLVFPSEGRVDVTLPTFHLLGSESLSTADVASKSAADVAAEASAIASASLAESSALLNKAKAESQAILQAATQKRSAVLSEAKANAERINNGAEKKVADAETAVRQARTNYNTLEGKISYFRYMERQYKEQRLDAVFWFPKVWEFEAKEKQMQKEEESFFKDTDKAKKVLDETEKEYTKQKESLQSQIDAAKKVLADGTNQANAVSREAEERSKKVLRDGEQKSKEVLKAGEEKVATLTSLLQARATAAK